MAAAPKICFVEALSYSVLNSAMRRSSTGGESVQHTLLARAFAERGWDVSMVSLDVGQEDDTVVDGIRCFKTYDRAAGIKGLRFLHPRLTSMWRALKKADADIYFQSCAGLMTGVVARYCASRGRRMIFRIAHDTDCIPGEQLINLERDRKIYDYGLRRADLISAQSVVQQELLEKNYGLPSVVVDMSAEIPDEVPEDGRDIDVLWVNNFRAFKRPELLLDIARAMPDVNFAMIGGRMMGHEALFDSVKEAADSIPNLNFVGAVPYSEVNQWFARAKVFLNTSDSEGFPNSFLQAWVRGVPVVSYFDPDGFIEGKDLGRSVASQDNFVDDLRELLSDDSKRLDIGRRSRQFVIDSYGSATIAGHYEHLIDERMGIRLG